MPHCVVCKEPLYAVPEAPRLGYCPVCRVEFLIDEDAGPLPEFPRQEEVARGEGPGQDRPPQGPPSFDPTQTRAYRMAARKLLQLPRYDKPLERDPNRRRKRILWRVFFLCLGVHVLLGFVIASDVHPIDGRLATLLEMTTLGVVLGGLSVLIYWTIGYSGEWGRPDKALAHEGESMTAPPDETVPPEEQPETGPRGATSPPGPSPETAITGDPAGAEGQGQSPDTHGFSASSPADPFGPLEPLG